MTKAEKSHKDALAQLGCLVCLRVYGPHDPAPVELHHLRAGGWGKGDFKTLIPLCPRHHRTGQQSLHGMGTKAFDRYYSEHYRFTQADLLADALALVGKKD